MIQTNHSASVSWPVAASSPTVAVPPVLAVAPAAAASGDNRAANEQAPKQAPQAEAEDKAAKAPTSKELAEQAAESLARREARIEAQRRTIEQLRDTLRKVWDASGAVVEQALAAEAAARQRDGSAAATRGLSVYNEPPQPSDPPGSRLNQRV